LENWRSALAEHYRLALPWWLDGTLERVLERSTVKSLASQPRQFPKRGTIVVQASPDSENRIGLFDVIRGGFAAIFRPGYPESGLVPVSLGEIGGSMPTRPTERWPVEVPLDQAEWRDRQDASRASELAGQLVVVEFTLRGERTPPALEVQMTDGPLTLDMAPGCRGRLLDDVGSLVQEACVQSDRLVFLLSSIEPSALLSWTLEIDFVRPRLYHLILRVPLRRPKQ
jgi:hypothetical protein